jgi:adenosine/AMP kinase
MAKVRVKMNDDGIRRLYEEIAANIGAADRAFRASHEGFPIEVVEADARRAIPGVEMDADTLHNYAAAVSEGVPFQFKLR